MSSWAVGGGGGGSPGLLQRPDHSHGAPPSQPCRLPEAPPPNTITLGVRIRHVNFGRDSFPSPPPLKAGEPHERSRWGWTPELLGLPGRHRLHTVGHRASGRSTGHGTATSLSARHAGCYHGLISNSSDCFAKPPSRTVCVADRTTPRSSPSWARVPVDMSPHVVDDYAGGMESRPLRGDGPRIKHVWHEMGGTCSGPPRRQPD